ncbi:MAG: glycosyltransferase family 4 protein [Alphaproteobacteria bacterium]|nr:glycosyltransferase family 4 protein [Alphaproteobacteria bacterium]
MLVDEFFGGWNTAIGGYGALARKYVCRLIPNHQIQIDVLLDCGGGAGVQQCLIDETMIYRLPAHPMRRRLWFDKQGFDLFLSIEMTQPSFEILHECRLDTPLLYWIQDPRHLEQYQSRLNTVSRIRDSDWAYLKDVTIWIKERIKDGAVTFISQGDSLSAIAREMYEIPTSLRIRDLANPIEIDFSYEFETPPKQDKIIFLGRLEAQKRAWIVCEIAKAMPQYEFYVLGATGRGRDEAANARSLELYRNPDGSSRIRNLHFIGHVDGDIKNDHIKSAKLLLNTSIWEGIPVSWLEALSYGTLIVSAFDRDNIVKRFGTFIGEIMGDGIGHESIQSFADAITYWLSHDGDRRAVATTAINYVRNRHCIDSFVSQMRDEILKATSP